MFEDDNDEPPSKHQPSTALLRQTTPALITVLLSQLLCGWLLENTLQLEISKIYPTLFIIDSLIVFLGTFELVFVLDILNLCNDDNEKEFLFSHIVRSLKYLLIQSITVGALIITISTLYRVVFKEENDILLYVLRASSAIFASCFISTVISTFSIVLCLIMCVKLSIDPDNVVLPLITTATECTTIYLSVYFLEKSLLFSYEIIYGLIPLLGVYLGSILFLHFAYKSERRIISLNIPVFILGIAYGASVLTSLLMELISLKISNIATIILVLTGVVVDGIMIYLGRLCGFISRFKKKDDDFSVILKQGVETEKFNGKLLCWLVTVIGVFYSVALFATGTSFIFCALLCILFTILTYFGIKIVPQLLIFENGRRSSEGIGRMALILMVAIVDTISLLLLVSVVWLCF